MKNENCDKRLFCDDYKYNHCDGCGANVKQWEDYSVTFYRCPDCGYLLEKNCPQCQSVVSLPSTVPTHWFDHIEKGCLKARHGDYVLYKVDYLLDNLAREVNIMEGARQMRGVDNDT